MPNLVIQGASLSCSMGIAPAQLIVLPTNMVNGPGSMPAACVMDSQPSDNIPSFGMCMSPANPAVAAATAAANGVLTPMPCSPMTGPPWVPGSVSVLVGGQAALNDSSTCPCLWGGTVSISYAGQTAVTTD